MQIIEQHLQGKHSAETCEDGIVTTDSYVAVIDGSTSKTPLQVCPGRSNGRTAMLAIAGYIRSARPGLSLAAFCDGLTACIRSIYETSAMDMERLRCTPEERLTASVIVYSLVRREVWMIGDCQCLVDGVLYTNEKPYEAQLAAERSRLAKAMNLRIGEEDSARKAILPALLEAMKGQNRDYAVVDGFPIPMDKVKVIPVGEGSEIVLASDGYPFLKPTLKESEEALARQLQADPLCIRTFKATKGVRPGNQSFDDRAYIRLCGN